jgi:hypothetical protein
MKISHLLRWTAVITSFTILVVAGWVHGMWSGRWHQTNALEGALVRVDQVPLEIGDWKAEALEADKASFAQAGAQNYWMRTYTHTRSKVSLLVILMCGRTGRMSVHTPEVCYRGAGYEVVENASLAKMQDDLETRENTFWTTKFRKEGGLGTNLRLYWAWNAQGSWQAPTNPRLDFRGEPFLYKLYVSYELTGSDPPWAKEFLQELLPVLQKTLFPAPQAKL